MAELLRNDVEVDPKDDNFLTPLYRAVRNNHLNVVKILIGRGADVNTFSHGLQTPLFQCAGRGYEELADLLIKHGADVNARDGDGATPLHTAAWNGQKAMVKLLLENGAKPVADHEGAVPAARASEKGYADIAAILATPTIEARGSVVPDGSDVTQAIRFACPQCYKGFQVESRFAGRKTTCPKCGAAISVPTPEPCHAPVQRRPFPLPGLSHTPARNASVHSFLSTSTRRSFRATAQLA